MRYNVLRDFGGKEPETRREYNARFGQPPGPEIEVPAVASHVWEWFWALSGRRPPSESGQAPISYSEIDAWARRMRITITPEEISMLAVMDDAYLAAQGEETRAAQQRSQAKAPAPKPK